MFKEYKKLVYCVVLLIVFLVITVIIKEYFKPFFIVTVLFFVCNPIYDFLTKNNIFKSKISAVVCLIMVNFVLFLIMFVIGNYLKDKFEIFMHSGYNMLEDTIDVLCNKISSIVKINLTVEGIKNKGAKLISGEFLKKGAMYTTEGIFSYLISNIAVYFMLVDKRRILSFTGKLINDSNVHFVQKKYNDINKLLKIEFALVLITTIETIFGFYALDIESALFLGILSGIFDLLPYIGIIIIFIPLIIYKISLGQYIIVIGLIFLFILLTISRQIMEARFMSHNLKIHPLPLILSLYIGLNVFGVIGLFIGPIYVITAKEIIMSS